MKACGITVQYPVRRIIRSERFEDAAVERLKTSRDKARPPSDGMGRYPCALRRSAPSIYLSEPRKFNTRGAPSRENEKMCADETECTLPPRHCRA